MKLSPPFLISARLLPAIRVGDDFVSLKHRGTTSEGRDVYIYYIDTPEFEHEGDDLKTGRQGGDYQEAMKSLLSFLSSAAESYIYQLRHGWEDDNLFPPEVMEWAYENSDEISLLSIELEELGKLIEY